MWLMLTLAVIGALLLVSEYWWRHNAKPNEFSRKFIHITIGSFVAFWPFFLSWPQILFLSGAFLLVVAASKYWRVFRIIHSVQRPTLGEVFFALAVGGVALITHNKGIYAVALLQMSLADGLAAVIGQQFGKASRYQVLKNTKSVTGTATFFVVSVLLLIGFAAVTHTSVLPVTIVGIALLASALENVGVYGLDNLLVPALIAVALKTLT